MKHLVKTLFLSFPILAIVLTVKPLLSYAGGKRLNEQEFAKKR